jgi:hypothetical protein
LCAFFGSAAHIRRKGEGRYYSRLWLPEANHLTDSRHSHEPILTKKSGIFVRSAVFIGICPSGSFTPLVVTLTFEHANIILLEYNRFDASLF